MRYVLLLIIGLVVSLFFAPELKNIDELGRRVVYPSYKPSLQVIEENDAIYRVVRVVDGDTIVVSRNNTDYKIRLLGIDTPEIIDPRKTVQCFGKEASKKAKDLLSQQNVSLESDPTQQDRDKYGRFLRYVFLLDGTNVNKLLISEGYAFEYTYDFPYRYQLEFRHAQKDAQNLQKGLWNPSACRKVK